MMVRRRILEHRRVVIFIFAIVAVSAIFGRPSSAFADCVLPPTAVCNGVSCAGQTRPEGALQYNSDHKVVQYCDGTVWRISSGIGPNCPSGDAVIMTSSGWECGIGACIAPSSCANVGDVCSDGSLFAGFIVYSSGSCAALYVTNNNQSAAARWKNSNGVDDINPQSLEDGQVNHANRIGTLSSFPAFDLCESNTYHGKSDWYLPARDELYLLWKNRPAIDANAAGVFFSSSYWGSGQIFGSGGWSQSFSGGGGSYGDKTIFLAVRCIRRD